MLQNQITKIVRNWRLRGLAKQVRNGITPRHATREEIMEALALTRPKNAVELFGFLTTRVFGADGVMRDDYRLQSVRKVTTEFTKFLADGLCNSAVAAGLDNFIYHGVGDGSTAEASGDVAMVSSQGTRVAGSQTHGATSNIYRSLKTFVASAAFTCIEHGLFDTLTAADDKLLDRSIITSPPTLATGDEVEFTYELTISSET